MKLVDNVALALTIIGALNWLIIGLFDLNIVTTIFGADTTATTVVYVVIGIAALWSIKYFNYRPATKRRNH